jgi:hypothetical protein
LLNSVFTVSQGVQVSPQINFAFSEAGLGSACQSIQRRIWQVDLPDNYSARPITGSRDSFMTSRPAGRSSTSVWLTNVIAMPLAR